MRRNRRVHRASRAIGLLDAAALISGLEMTAGEFEQLAPIIKGLVERATRLMGSEWVATALEEGSPPE